MVRKMARFRSRPTKIIGERFYIYASRKWAGVNGHDALLPLPLGEGRGEGAHKSPPANGHALTPNPSPKGRGGLPTGVIVGTARITRCIRENGHYCWHLADVRRLNKPRKPKRMPQPVWFRPF